MFAKTIVGNISFSLISCLEYGMRLRFVHCAARSTPPHFVVHVMIIIVQSVLTLTFMGTKRFLGTIHVTCVEQVESTNLVLCFVLCREGFGVDSGLFGGLL